MKTKWMTLATLALILSPSLAFAHPGQNSGTRDHTNEYHDHTPHVHERGTSTR